MAVLRLAHSNFWSGPIGFHQTNLDLPMNALRRRLANVVAILFCEPPASPSLLLVCGGDRSRELEAVRAAREYAGIREVVVSSGEASRSELKAAIDPGLSLVWDRRACDTLSNFTVLASEWQFDRGNVRSVVIATSDYHRRRAAAVGAIVLASARVQVHAALGLPSTTSSAAARGESALRTARDVVRAVLWVLTGWDGRGVALRTHPSRRLGIGELEKLA